VEIIYSAFSSQLEYTRFPWAAGEPLRATHYGLTEAFPPTGVSHIPVAMVASTTHIFHTKIRIPIFLLNKHRQDEMRQTLYLHQSITHCISYINLDNMEGKTNGYDK